jgi:hypothetical protein
VTPAGGHIGRIVALGASNLTRGFHTLVSAARTAWGPEIEILAALGHGRPYGGPSRFLVRGLPGILESGVWRALESRDWQGRAVLIVRGDGGREWLADTLRAQGAEVSFVAAYRRVVPALDSPLLDEAIARPSAHLWFFSSSEAIANLQAGRPAQDWAASLAIATHPRIAERARDCGFGVVRESPPTLDAVVACIQSFAS